MAPSTPPPRSPLQFAAFTIVSPGSPAASPAASSTLVLPKRRLGTGCRGPEGGPAAEAEARGQSLAPPQSNDYFAPRTASFAALATTNLRRLRAGILIASPVWGFRPIRAL